MEIIAIAGLALPAAAAYTAPAILACARHLPAARRVIAVNLFLGWTLIGWAAALSLAIRPAAAVPSAGRDQLPGSSPHLPPGGPAVGRQETPVISVWNSLS